MNKHSFAKKRHVSARYSFQTTFLILQLLIDSFSSFVFRKSRGQAIIALYISKHTRQNKSQAMAPAKQNDCNNCKYVRSDQSIVRGGQNNYGYSCCWERSSAKDCSRQKVDYFAL